jgi:hypothetical protein
MEPIAKGRCGRVQWIPDLRPNASRNLILRARLSMRIICVAHFLRKILRHSQSEKQLFVEVFWTMCITRVPWEDG